jgi:hypothetical protein
MSSYTSFVKLNYCNFAIEIEMRIIDASTASCMLISEATASSKETLFYGYSFLRERCDVDLRNLD